MVEPVEEEQGKIFIPPVFRDRMKNAYTGRVFACGPGSNGVPMPVKPGDTVVFNKWQGTQIEYQGKKMVVIKPNLIYAVA